MLYPVSITFVILNRLINECIFGVETPYYLKIEKGFKIWHENSFIINRSCVIGANFTVGDNVSMGAHSGIISDDIIIGDNVTIGAGVIVFKSIPPDCTVTSDNQVIIRHKSGD